jgi:hypothetical protein
MSQQEKIVIKTSPVVFLTRLIFIEFFFALATTVLYFWVDFRQVYENLPVAARIFSLEIAVTIIITSFQIFIIAIAFITWYADTYEVDKHRIIRRRGNLFGLSEVAQTQALTDINVTQSKLGDSFNYGTLELTALNTTQKRSLKNISNPLHYAAVIRQLIAPQQIDVNRKLQKSIPEMIAEGEGQYAEFKSSFSWDYRRQSINRELNKAVMKNVTALMNTTGGVILMGVDDEGEILGMEKEFQTLRKPNADGFENNFNMIFNKMVGVEYSNYTKVDFAKIEEKTVCRVVVLPAPEPVYLKHKNNEEFYIRTGNSSQPLSISQAVKYIQTHFED